MEQLEHLEKWCEQDQSGLNKDQILHAVITLCNAGREKRSAQPSLERLGQPCPEGEGIGSEPIVLSRQEICVNCDGTGRVG